MATVHQLPTRTEAVTLGVAVAAFLDTFNRPEQAGTRRTYADVLTQLQRAPPPRTDPVGMLDHPAVAAELTDWFAKRWGAAGPATWNRNLACLRSACAYWRTQHWITGDPTAGLARAKLPPARARARSRTAVADLLARPELTLRERTLWALLYESAARRVQLATTDLDPDTGRARLSYRRAAELFTQSSRGWTLHDLRHSALTHAAEDGMPTPMLMTKSGHASIRTLSRYSRPSVDTLARWHDQRDPPPS